MRELLERATMQGTAAYVKSRKARIPEFVDRYFSFRGAWAMHKKTLGRDFYRLPLNLLWSLPALLAHSAAAVSGRLGAHRIGHWLERIPNGLPTEFQNELKWLIHVELLELPYTDGSRSSTKDALLEAILSDPELSSRLAVYLSAIQPHAASKEFREALASRLSVYGNSRQAATELAGNIATLAAGYAALGQATPGAVSAGTAVASAIAQQLAIANFWLGPTLGAWYYSAFPASASFGLIAASTGAVMAAAGVIASLSAVVIDPLLAKTGLHRKRLERFVDTLGQELNGQGSSSYRVRELYLARIFDLIDLLQLAARMAR